MTRAAQPETPGYDGDRIVDKRRAINVMTAGLSHRERLFELLGDLSQYRVLELGCGSAQYTTRYEQLHAARLVAIDSSLTQIQRAWRALSERSMHTPVWLLVADAHVLPFPDGSYDIVSGLAILHHLRLREGVRELVRVLKPSGRAVFSEPLAHNPLLRLFRLLTPGARTPDEHPLNWRDLAVLSEYFHEVNHEEFGLLAVLAGPLRYITRYVGVVDRALIRLCESLDALVFRLFPASRRYARVTVIQLSRPKKSE